MVDRMESDLGKLFIGGISWDTDEDRLREYFGNYGELVEAVIMRDRTTGRARGFGFIVFADPAVAERVIIEKHMIDGRMVEAKRAVPRDDQHILNRNTSSIHSSPGPGRTKKIFVGGLASTVTETDFKNYFDQFGTITDVVVMYDHHTQRPRGFGFITYDSEDAVDRVLHKTFHELNDKMVEVKRAVPKELSPGPSRSSLMGYNYGLSRANNFLSAYAQGYNMSSVAGFGVRMDGRLNTLAGGRSGFPTFGSTAYGMGLNLDPSLSPSYGGIPSFNNSLGYERLLNPYYNGNQSRYTTPIGYSGGNTRSDSVSSSTARSVWGNGGLNNSTNSPRPGAYLGSGNGSFGVSFGNSGPNWGTSIIAQGGRNASGYTSGSMSYGSGDNSSGLGGGYLRNSTSMAPPSSFVASTGGYEGSYGGLYNGGSVYGDSDWRSTTPELDRSGLFHYGLGEIAPDVTDKNSDGYVGTYNASRQSNRGIAA
ncbi:heterogeneous nuclear ribonucleoprotein 1-like isoform X3 [Tripterygium wilfordii]|nr:heterogeneous nuclear ribonucleoprotein 1-like isoform X3 [Tripterygium wilfordii]